MLLGGVNMRNKKIEAEGEKADNTGTLGQKSNQFYLSNVNRVFCSCIVGKQSTNLPYLYSLKEF